LPAKPHLPRYRGLDLPKAEPALRQAGARHDRARDSGRPSKAFPTAIIPVEPADQAEVILKI